ncbi:MAG: heme ABC exporter ATP-binding protein CcmA [Rickettsiales bacterium]|nr:heme ABC exporter ATP-binding protein CcmA [Rickettsiales bacterium]
MTKDTLEWKNLHMERGGYELFRGLSARLESGNILVLKGKNGSGKSTLLKLLAGVLQPSYGEILFNNSNISNSPLYGKHVAYVGHRLAVVPYLTVEENLQFWAKLYDRSELLDAALHYFDLNRYRDVLSAHLSAGWKQRVALARLILSPASVWLLDEPASHMDDEGVALMESLVATRKEQGGIIVMSLHSHVSEEHVSILNIDSYKKNLR